MVSSPIDTLEQRAILVSQLARMGSVPPEIRQTCEEEVATRTDQQASVARLIAPRQVVMVRGSLIVGRRMTDLAPASPTHSPVVRTRADQIAARLKRRHDDHAQLAGSVQPRELQAGRSTDRPA